MSDRLTLAHAFEDAGMPREKAERVASTVYETIRGEVARKADLLELEQRLITRLMETDTRLTDRITSVEQCLTTRLTDRITSVEQGLTTRITRVEQGLTTRITSLEQRLSKIESRVAVLTWMTGANIALVVAVLVKLFRIG